MNEIHLIPTAGLCNRLRAIASAVFISKQLHLPLTVYWNRYEGLNAQFSQLFNPIDSSHATLVESESWRMHINRTKDFLLRRIFLTDYRQVIYNFNLQNKGDIFPLIHTDKNGKLLLISCYSMSETFDMHQLFKPRQELQQQIDSITKSFDKYTIGVHIRRTDNKLSISDSPIEGFVKLLQDEISKEPHTNFYLATDDDAVKLQLKDIFKDRLLCLHNTTSRNSLEGMQFAVVELFTLAKTCRIIGSNYSSYSQTAALLGNIPLTYAK